MYFIESKIHVINIACSAEKFLRAMWCQILFSKFVWPQ